MANPLVSVVIPVYNGERFLRDTLESALGQTYQPIEIIVVNDGSTDNTEGILREYAGRIKWISQSNQGISSARNRGVSAAQGEWAAFLDSDDFWDPDKLTAQMAAMTGWEAAVHSDVRHVDASGRLLFESWAAQVVAKGFDGWERSPSDASGLPDMLRACRFVMSTLVIRKRALETVHGFDDSNRVGSEDYQLGLRLAASGCRLRFVNRVLASVREHDRNFSGDVMRMQGGWVYAIEKTRQEYPSAFGVLENRICRNMLHQLHFNLAWHLYDERNYAEAGRHFRGAVRQRPLRLRSWLLAAACSLPFRKRLVPILRQSISGMKRIAP